MLGIVPTAIGTCGIEIIPPRSRPVDDSLCELRESVFSRRDIFNLAACLATSDTVDAIQQALAAFRPTF